MPTLLNRVGFVGRQAPEVGDAARQQRFNSGELELRGVGREGQVYVSRKSGSFGRYAVAFIKDRFFSLVRVKRFAAGDQKAEALISFREQINELNVTKPRLKEKYLRELDFKFHHGLPLRASYHSKAVQELFSVIDAEAGGVGEGRINPPEYNDELVETRQNEAEGVPSYARAVENPPLDFGDIGTDIQIHPVPFDFERNPRPIEQFTVPVPVPVGGQSLFGSPDVVPRASADEVPGYDDAVGHVEHAMGIQRRVYDETQRVHIWEHIEHLHRPPEKRYATGSYSGVFGEHASRFDQVAGSAEYFFRHYLKPALEEAGTLPQFRSEFEQNAFASECLKSHKNNYMGMVAQRLQNPEPQQSPLGYGDIREFLEMDVCSATLAGESESLPEAATMRQKIFQPQMEQVPAIGVEEENRVITERLQQKFGLTTGEMQAYDRACGLAAASNAYVLMAHRGGDTRVTSQWFSKNPPRIEDFREAAQEAIEFSEAASRANGKAINGSDLEMKIFKTLCEQSWKNYSGPGENKGFIDEPPSEVMVDMALRQAWKECSCLGKRRLTGENQPITNYLNIFGKDQEHDCSETFTNLYRNALAEKVRDVKKGDKNYELECLLRASDLLVEIEKEVAGLSLCDLSSPPELGLIEQSFLENLYNPLCQEIGGDPARNRLGSVSSYLTDLVGRLEVLGAYEMDIVAKTPGLVDDVQNSPVILSKVYEKVLAKMILHDLGRGDEANSDAYLEGVCNRACEELRNGAIQDVSAANNQERISALEALGIMTNPNGGGTEALLYLQHLSKEVIRLELRDRDLNDGGMGAVNEKMLDNVNIMQLEGSGKYIENVINHWTAKKTAVGQTVTAEALQMHIFTKINELCWWQCRRQMHDRTDGETFGGGGLSMKTRNLAMQATVHSYKYLAREGTDALIARGPTSFFAYAVTGHPFSENQKAYGKLRFANANQIRKEWREEMNIPSVEDDFPAFRTPAQNLKFLLEGRVFLRDLLDRNLALQA